jgi:hypothetical protein
MVNKQERRKHTRYPIKEGAYATISPDSSKLGQIVNISLAGLVFKYIDTEPDARNNEIASETIFLSSMGYYVGDINFQTVLDYEMPDCTIPEASFNTMKIRIRHVKFLDLKLKQLFDLDYYIENNTEGTNSYIDRQ